jgi:hypothetical protein
MKQYEFFDEIDRLKELSKLGDPPNASTPASTRNNFGKRWPGRCAKNPMDPAEGLPLIM